MLQKRFEQISRPVQTGKQNNSGFVVTGHAIILHGMLATSM
jgi:hypothetical protein